MTAMALQDRPVGTGPEVDLWCVMAADEDDGCLMIGLSGELDLAGADAFVDLVVCLYTDGQRMLVVDLAGVDFVDVAGLQALRSARRVAAGYRARLTITGARPSARRPLALTGFGAELEAR